MWHRRQSFPLELAFTHESEMRLAATWLLLLLPAGASGLCGAAAARLPGAYALRPPVLLTRATCVAIGRRPRASRLDSNGTYVNVEVLPPLPATSDVREPLALSDRSVANIFEIIFRDTRMLLSTAQNQPLPVVLELVWDRLPIAMWFLRDRSAKLELDLNRKLGQVSFSKPSS
ncbi:MAG: hypothetical protein SGPRY_004213 [Prymnesium sp.]